jgi:hypothetical protein
LLGNWVVGIQQGPEQVLMESWTQADIDRFWTKVQKTPGCWLWMGAPSSHGYGEFSRGRKWRDLPHRIAFAMSHGPIPEGLVVRHSCDNKRCCNPVHLSIGTHGDNVRDTNVRRRRPQVKLSIEQAQEIRERLVSVPKGARTGMGVALAQEYGVTPSTISVIKLHKQWDEEYYK